ncbi:woronin body major [Fusarium globosum]|uniref:Woronin body major n=1 Tax=Fusarium globosum TaxID=78864 RepID=A0A8H5Y1A4_9HYPO|nr:woronin body major [Fusarium globosum]
MLTPWQVNKTSGKQAIGDNKPETIDTPMGVSERGKTMERAKCVRKGWVAGTEQDRTDQQDTALPREQHNAQFGSSRPILPPSSKAQFRSASCSVPLLLLLPPIIAIHINFVKTKPHPDKKKRTTEGPRSPSTDSFPFSSTFVSRNKSQRTSCLPFEFRKVARVPVPFSIFPSTYRESESHTQTVTETKTHEEVEIKPQQPQAGREGQYSSVSVTAEQVPPRGEQHFSEEEVRITREEERYRRPGVQKFEHEEEHFTIREDSRRSGQFSLAHVDQVEHVKACLLSLVTVAIVVSLPPEHFLRSPIFTFAFLNSAGHNPHSSQALRPHESPPAISIHHITSHHTPSHITPLPMYATAPTTSAWLGTQFAFASHPRSTSALKPFGLSKAVELPQGPPASRCHMIRKRDTIDIHQLTQTNPDLNLPLNTNPLKVDTHRHPYYSTPIDLAEREYRQRYRPAQAFSTEDPTSHSHSHSHYQTQDNFQANNYTVEGRPAPQFYSSEKTEINNFTVDGRSSRPQYNQTEKTEFNNFTVDGRSSRPQYTSEKTEINNFTVDGRSSQPQYRDTKTTQVNNFTVDTPVARPSNKKDVRFTEETVETTKVDNTKSKMGYYDDDGQYNSFRAGAHKLGDRIAHGGRRDIEIDIHEGPRPSADCLLNTVSIPCHHIRLGDFLMLQGRPCQVIRISTSSATGQYRYLGVDLFTKQLHEESSFISNPAPSVVVQSMLGPVFKQYRVLDMQEGQIVAMTETGDVKQGLPVIDQSNLYSRLHSAFESGRGSVRVLVLNDGSRELAVDMKVIHGSRL